MSASTTWQEWVSSVNLERERRSLLRTPRILQATNSSIKVLADGRKVILFSSNDYLGLSSHPDVKAGISTAARAHGNGPRAAAIVAGHSHIHEELELELASLKHTEACLLFSSGFAANSGSIAALCAQGGVAVFSDALNHASLVDGIRMAVRSGSRLHVFRHRDYRHLEQLLQASPPTLRRLVVTDGVFSMDGDVADLKAIVALKKRFDCLVMVDDAHGTLVLGERGGGTAEASGTCQDIDVHMGTLSKAFGAFGGFVACSREMKSFLINHARSYIYSTALPVPVAAGALAALHVFRRDSWRSQHLQNLMAKCSLALSMDIKSPIIAVVVGSEDDALSLAGSLFEKGFHCPAIRPPTVPAGTSRLRITLTAEHSEADIDRLLLALSESGIRGACRSRLCLPTASSKL